MFLLTTHPGAGTISRIWRMVWQSGKANPDTRYTLLNTLYLGEQEFLLTEHPGAGTISRMVWQSGKAYPVNLLIS